MISNPMSIFKEIPTAETQRLFLRQMTVEDSDDMYDYASDPRVSEYLLWKPHESREYTRSYIAFLQKAYRKGDFYDWAVVEKASGRMIGTAGFAKIDEKNDLVEIGYVLSAKHWGKGYGSELAAFLLHFAFTVLCCERVEARYIVGNTASRHVMDKCGMTFEGIHRKSLLVKGCHRDIGMCSILREEYEENGGYRTVFQADNAETEEKDEKFAKFKKTGKAKPGYGSKFKKTVSEKLVLSPQGEGASAGTAPLRTRWYDRLRKNYGR